jgi:dihydroxyacetone kinase-like protein
MIDQLSLQQTVDMFVYVADRMEEAAPRLNEADQVIGDGDHGEAMARGWRAAQEAVTNGEFNNVGDVLSTVGMRMMAAMGGASGAIFGTWFRGGSKSLTEADTFSAETLAILLNDGLEAVKARGHANPGDKTMVDALQPAATAAGLARTKPISEALPSVASAAQRGVDATKEIVARLGRARTLGERSLGHPDPGALSTYLILQHMADYIGDL